MKLSITPSNPDQSLQHSVVIETFRDELDANELVDLFRCAMRGMDFTERTIEEVLPVNQETENQNYKHPASP